MTARKEKKKDSNDLDTGIFSFNCSIYALNISKKHLIGVTMSKVTSGCNLNAV